MWLLWHLVALGCFLAACLLASECDYGRAVLMFGIALLAVKDSAVAEIRGRK